MYSTAVLSLALAAAVARAATIPTSTSYTSKFDDLAPGLSTSQIGPYNGLDWQGINVIAAGLAGTSSPTGLQPESGPNVAVYGAKSAAAEGQPRITTQYVGSVTDAFDLYSFYFGCVANTLATAAVSKTVPCSVAVTGSKGTRTVATQVFYSNTDTGLTPPMGLATLVGFKGVDTVTFATEYTVDDVDVNVLGATWLDDVSYTTYNA